MHIGSYVNACHFRACTHYMDLSELHIYVWLRTSEELSFCWLHQNWTWLCSVLRTHSHDFVVYAYERIHTHALIASYLTFIITLDMCDCSHFMQFESFSSWRSNTCSSLAARNVIASIDCVLYQYKLYVNQQNHCYQPATLLLLTILPT